MMRMRWRGLTTTAQMGGYLGNEATTEEGPAAALAAISRREASEEVRK